MKNGPITLPIHTKDGDFLAHYSERGLWAIDFPGGSGSVPAKPQNGFSTKILEWHRTTELALNKLLAGERPVKLPPLDLHGTEFQKSVWREMLRILPGKTKSYGEIAEAIGKPGAVRAVGSACGANHIPVFVPCHRVLAANKKIGGFSSGLHWKRKLLAREGVAI